MVKERKYQGIEKKEVVLLKFRDKALHDIAHMTKGRKPKQNKYAGNSTVPWGTLKQAVEWQVTWQSSTEFIFTVYSPITCHPTFQWSRIHLFKLYFNGVLTATIHQTPLKMYVKIWLNKLTVWKCAWPRKLLNIPNQNCVLLCHLKECKQKYINLLYIWVAVMDIVSSCVIWCSFVRNTGS